MSSGSPDTNRRRFYLRPHSLLASAGVVAFPVPGMPDFRHPALRSRQTDYQRTLRADRHQLADRQHGVMNANNGSCQAGYETGCASSIQRWAIRAAETRRWSAAWSPAEGARQGLHSDQDPAPRRPAEFDKDMVLSNFAGCLKRLQTTTVDVLMLHQPSVEQMIESGAHGSAQAAKSEKKHASSASPACKPAATLDTAAIPVSTTSYGWI